jgi:creatinine amidohydrolase
MKRLLEMRTPEFLALPREQTVILFPVGVMEDHGPHLPLGMDLIHAQALTQELGLAIEATQPGWKAVLMQGAPLAINANTSHLALTQRAHVLRDFLVDTCLDLHRLGFRHFVAVTGTLGPRQLTAIEDAGRVLRRRTGGLGLGRLLRTRSAKSGATLVCAQSALLSRAEALRAPLWTEPTDHGGQADTSVALHAASGLVAPEWKLLPPLEPTETGLGHAWALSQGRVSGYVGAPGKATVEEGRQFIHAQVLELLPKLQAVWEGELQPERGFRSWYSVFPPNRSFFWGWVLASAIAALMALWMMTNVQMLVEGAGVTGAADPGAAAVAGAGSR